MTKYVAKSAIAGASLLAMVGTVFADDFNYAGGWPPNAAPTKAIEDFAVAVGEYSGGDVNIKVFPLSLLSFAESNEGLRDGIADLSVILTPYFPSEFPNMNMLSEFSQLAELDEFSGELASAAYAGATTEHVMTNCPDCQKEVSAQNQVFLGAASTTSYVLQCVVPLETIADLQGKRIRTAGAFWSRWAETVGAVPVSMSINETLEGLNQGVIDCTASNTADFVNFSFIDVVKYVYVGLPGAQFVAPSMMNKDSWNGLSDDSKTAMLKGHAKLTADMTWVYIEEGRAGRELAADKGIEYVDASPELVSMNQEFIAKDKDTVGDIYKDRFELETGSAASDAMTNGLRKWTNLVANVQTPQELAELYWSEIYSKIDLDSYGK